MDKMLNDLFDFQRFEKNKKMESIIDRVELKYDNELSEDLLELASGGKKNSDDEVDLDKVLGLNSEENGD
ncbi:MAG: hypothetical protein K6F00_11905 [Lachnospiraceae bacterium]|nr:hypothetical protein [Lachnospiraceae bacterium]